MAVDAVSVPELVSVEWLKEHFNQVKMVDASWAMRKNKREDFELLRIPGCVKKLSPVTHYVAPIMLLFLFFVFSLVMQGNIFRH
jgi:hypothetical protein